MLVKFNENNQSTTFIKALVTATPLPIYNCIQDGDRIIEGCYYIYHGMLIKCIVGGILDKRMNDLAPGKAYVNLDNSTFLVLDDIAFGSYHINVTRKETCPNSYYDYDTHRLLGKYLRMLRSYYNIDLMHLYNCFDGTLLDDVYIRSNTDEYYLKLAKNNKYKVLWVPIKFNTKYTIYLDTDSPVRMCPVFRDNSGCIKIALKRDNTAKSIFDLKNDEKHHMYDTPLPDYESDDFNLEYYRQMRMQYYADAFKPIPGSKLSNLQFKKPVVWEGITCEDKDIYELENYLGLLIQVDRNNNSSVVVLEGDKSHESRFIFNAQNEAWLITPKDEEINDHNYRLPDRTKGVKYILDELTPKQFNDLFRTPKQLTLVNDKNIYAFNDKIIPFLLHHVITNMEMIEGNIGDVQKYIPNDYEYEDIWSDRLRIDVYNKYLSNFEETKFDVTGFIDADVERYINKYKERIIN